MVQPGDQAGDCPRCEATMICIGHGHSVLGTNCPECNLTVATSGDAVTIHDVQDGEIPRHIEGSPVGPDPNP